jgi:hypothetical protein
MHVLEPGWEVPDTLPAGVTVAPAADPTTAARVIAEHIGGELVVDVAAAERALAREAARRRARQVVADATEADRLCARLDELSARARRDRADSDETSAMVARLAAVVGDVTADPDALLAAAARLRVATVTADAAARVVGERPSTVAAEIELVRARSLVTALAGDLEDSGRPRTPVLGAVAMSAGAALVAVGVGLPVALAAVVPGATTAGLATRWRRARRDDTRARVEADAAAADADRAEAALAGAADAVREWQARADAAAAARDELDAARDEWVGRVGFDVPVERAERLADARRRLVAVATDLGVAPTTPATQLMFELSRRAAESAVALEERGELQARLRELLHGRRLDRLQAEADAARATLAAPSPAAMVLCDPFAAVGRHRRRELFEDLERAASGIALAVVTSDDEALAWASARRTAEIG